MEELSIQCERELNKLEKKCYDNELIFEFNKVTFPIIAKITPSEDKKNQLVMKFDDELDSDYVNGEVQFIFEDELVIKTLNDFYIEDDLLNSIKNAAKKLHYLYLQMYFKDVKKATPRMKTV